MNRRLLAALRSLFYAAFFVLLWTWVIASVRPLDAGFIAIPAWAWWPGVVLAVLGALLVAACLAAFVLVGVGTPAPFDAPREFVAAGPYRWVRNPMYLGAMAAIAGAGLILRSPATLGVAVGFFLLVHLFVVLYEEPTLERRFGAGYLAYKRRVNRWWPRPEPVTRRDDD